VRELPQEIKSVFPWVGSRKAVDGGEMHYVDVGPRGGSTIVAVHGNPTWSFYWRNLIRAFCTEHRVIVPDHIGCGLSDKPQDWGYTLDQHISNLCSLIDSLEVDDITLVVHDWGGAIGMGLASRRPHLISRLVITNTAAFRSKEIPLSIASCRIPGFGELAVLGMNAFARAATIRATSKGLDAVTKKGLLWPYDTWKNRIATLKFVHDIPLKPEHESYQTLVAVEEGLAQFEKHPMLICWGDQDFCFTPNFRKEWERRFPNAVVHAWPDVGHYVMEDATERLIDEIQSFISRD